MVANIRTTLTVRGELVAGIDTREAETWVAQTVFEARNILNKNMRGQKGGRTYRFGQRFYTASKPDEYPAVRSGELRTGTRVKTDGLRGEIGSNIEYAEYLQDGTKRMEARRLYNEALLEAVDDMRPKLEDVFFVEVRNVGEPDN